MNTIKKSISENEVLFQRLGNTWYAFSEIKGEVVYSALPDGVDPRETRLELYDIIEDHMKRVAKYQRVPEMAA